MKDYPAHFNEKNVLSKYTLFDKEATYKPSKKGCKGCRVCQTCSNLVRPQDV